MAHWTTFTPETFCRGNISRFLSCFQKSATMLYWFLTVSCNIPLPQQKNVAFNENRLVQHGLEIFVEIVVKNRVFNLCFAWHSSFQHAILFLMKGDQVYHSKYDEPSSLKQDVNCRAQRYLCYIFLLLVSRTTKWGRLGKPGCRFKGTVLWSCRARLLEAGQILDPLDVSITSVPLNCQEWLQILLTMKKEGRTDLLWLIGLQLASKL